VKEKEVKKKKEKEFEKAKVFVISFGKYKGQTLDMIACTKEGLEYLDWLVGQEWCRNSVKEHLENYLSDKSIQKELSAGDNEFEELGDGDVLEGDDIAFEEGRPYY